MIFCSDYLPMEKLRKINAEFALKTRRQQLFLREGNQNSFATDFLGV